MSKRNRSGPALFLFSLFILIFLFPNPAPGRIDNSMCKRLDPFIGNQDAILIADAEGRLLCAKNEEKQLIPASTLKILTGLVAMKHLGPDHRFKTEFYLDPDNYLKIKGYGDPLLVSETISEITLRLTKYLKRVNGIFLDSSFFGKGLQIPGITDSFEPYDAPNGALCANFNTVSFKRKGNRVISAEPQTPLLPVVRPRIRRSNQIEGRIVLSNNQHEATLYVGHLFAYFLKESGVQTGVRIGLKTVDNRTDRVIFIHKSGYRLAQVISELMEYSNNFVANQLLIASGAAALGRPGSLEKGVRSALTYARQTLGVSRIVMVEGSGISRKNRLSASGMHRILKAFMPYRTLLRSDGAEFYKTGSLAGIRTRAGYVENRDGHLYLYVLFLNTPGKSTGPIMKMVINQLK